MAEVLTQDKILHECPRLSMDSSFTFECGRSLDCFTHCCSDVSIVLTPFDVVRMKNALGLDSSEFLQKYTVSPFTKDQKVPAVLLKMDPETKRCPFVTEEGCSMYRNRPWACRMYPLGVAEPKNATPEDHGFHFLVRDEICHGHERGRARTVLQWLAEQGIEEYEAMGASFRDLMLDGYWDKEEPLTPQKMDMYFMSCYDLDRFRRFIFESRFLELFEVDEARVAAIRTDDTELLEFAMQWLRFVLFQDRTMKLRRSAAPRQPDQPGVVSEEAR